MLVIVANGRKYYLYNHFDSGELYGWAGDDLIALLKTYTIDEIKQKITEIKWISPDRYEDEVDEKVPQTYYRDLGRSCMTWYEILRGTQGHFARNIEIGYGVDYGELNVADLDVIVALDLDQCTINNQLFDSKTGCLLKSIDNQDYKKWSAVI